MKSPRASSIQLKASLVDKPVSLILLSEPPIAGTVVPADYSGNQPTEIKGWTINGSRASNSEKLDLPKNKGTTTARVAAWAVIDGAGNWIYANTFPEPFDIRPNNEPYLEPGDIVIDD